MKIRSDFVSNSSSSSFVVIGGSDNKTMPFEWSLIPILLPSKQGCYEFGWSVNTYNDFWSKLNWCALMISDERHNNKEHAEEMEALLKEVCAMNFNLNVAIMSDEKICELGAYIDHQSSIVEKPQNAIMFKNSSKLIRFLSSSESYIETGNDNG